MPSEIIRTPPIWNWVFDDTQALFNDAVSSSSYGYKYRMINEYWIGMEAGVV
jgi:hypothetical protein